MRPLTSELAKILIGGRVDKITQQNKVNFTISPTFFILSKGGKNF
jgi:hypothetical protein